MVHYHSTNTSDIIFYRCTAMSKDIEGHRQVGRRSHNHTKRLKEIIDSRMLWDKYEIDDKITVRHPPLGFDCSHKPLAIHNSIFLHRHLWNVISWYPTLANQGNVQGPPSQINWCLPTYIICYAWTSRIGVSSYSLYATHYRTSGRVYSQLESCLDMFRQS
jgi:hypothetical protein